MKIGRNGRSKLITITMTKVELRKFMGLVRTRETTPTGNSECTWCGGEGSCSPRCSDKCPWPLLQGISGT